MQQIWPAHPGSIQNLHANRCRVRREFARLLVLTELFSELVCQMTLTFGLLHKARTGGPNVKIGRLTVGSALDEVFRGKGTSAIRTLGPLLVTHEMLSLQVRIFFP